jgi:hypothetical protein
MSQRPVLQAAIEISNFVCTGIAPCDIVRVRVFLDWLSFEPIYGRPVRYNVFAEAFCHFRRNMSLFCFGGNRCLQANEGLRPPDGLMLRVQIAF